MKTILVLSAGILIAGAVSAQTTVKSQESAATGITARTAKGYNRAHANGQASSATSVNTTAADDAAARAAAVKEKGQTVAAEKKAATQQKAQAAKAKAVKESSEDHSVAVSTSTDGNLTTGAANNNINENASVQGKAAVSTAETKQAANSTASQATLKAENSAKGIATATAKGGKALAKGVQVRPVPVKINSHVNAGSALRVH